MGGNPPVLRRLGSAGMEAAAAGAVPIVSFAECAADDRGGGGGTATTSTATSVSDEAGGTSGSAASSCDSDDSGSADGWVSPLATVGAGGSGVWATPADVWDAPSGAEAGRRSEVARAVLPGSPAMVFNALFVGDWIYAYHAARGNREVVVGDWAHPPPPPRVAAAGGTAGGTAGTGPAAPAAGGSDTAGTGAAAAPLYPTRTVTYVYPLTLRIGPKSTRVVETHTYSFMSPPPGGSGPGVLVEVSGHNLDVPCADAFRTETAFALTPVDSPADAGAAGGGAAAAGGAATLVAVSAGVHFTRAFPLRGKIERGARDDCAAAYRELLALAATTLAASPPLPVRRAEATGGARHRRRRGTSRSRGKGVEGAIAGGIPLPSSSPASRASASAASAVAAPVTATTPGVATRRRIPAPVPRSSLPLPPVDGATAADVRRRPPATQRLAAAASSSSAAVWDAACRRVSPALAAGLAVGIVAVAGVAGGVGLLVSTAAAVRSMRADVAVLVAEVASLRREVASLEAGARGVQSPMG